MQGKSHKDTAVCCGYSSVGSRLTVKTEVQVPITTGIQPAEVSVSQSFHQGVLYSNLLKK